MATFSSFILYDILQVMYGKYIHTNLTNRYDAGAYIVEDRKLFHLGQGVAITIAELLSKHCINLLHLIQGIKLSICFQPFKKDWFPFLYLS